MAIFMDTNILISYYNEDDENHEKAEKLIEDIFKKRKYGEIVTSDYVFNECMNVCIRRTKSKNKTIELGQMMFNSMTIFNVSIPIFKMSWELFKEIKMNFTDCTNIILVIWYGIENIATFDKQFKNVNNINVIDK
ncbi:MAG: type II toxin-antitoxin system VapC family toxin [Candidatus Aenigmarchaeota archaeon]|nr:type II toxin-antitoxin system VapC family toxin [Candidatus Aenigmarchaeota archaeon]